MVGLSAVWSGAQRLATRGLGPQADDRELVRRTSLILYIGIVVAIAPVWVLTYLALGRPTSALIPLVYMAVSVASLAWFRGTGRFGVVPATQIVMILAFPLALQWTLGGFVNGSAVALWSFTAAIVALAFYGPRTAGVVFGLYAAGIAISAALELAVPPTVEPLPQGVVIGFFVLDAIAPLAVAMAVLVYVTRQRDLASRRSDELLLNILPAPIAARLKRGEAPIADRHEEASVLFLDMVGFTPFADRTTAERVVEVLDRAYAALDELVEQRGLEKVKTVGDAYMVVGGVPQPRADHAAAVADLALAIAPTLARAIGSEWPDMQVRIGIECGPVVAGVIGRRKIAYGVWGDTVNTASRMETTGIPGAIQVTERFRDRLQDTHRFERRGEVDVKGKRPMTTYLLLGRA